MWRRWSLPGLVRTRATPRLERWWPLCLCGLAAPLTGEERRERGKKKLALLTETSRSLWKRTLEQATVESLDDRLFEIRRLRKDRRRGPMECPGLGHESFLEIVTLPGRWLSCLSCRAVAGQELPGLSCAAPCAVALLFSHVRIHVDAWLAQSNPIEGARTLC